MGPYYQVTTQGVGGVIDMFYQYPILMLLFVVGTVAAAVYFLRRKNSGDQSES